MEQSEEMDLIASLALTVSILSLALSVYSVWRVLKKETPHAWAEVEKFTSVPNLFTMTINLRNPTQYILEFDALAVPIRRIPVDEKQDFCLVQYGAYGGRSQEWVKENFKATGSALKLGVSGEIGSGEVGTVKAHLIRGNLSAASEENITVFYWSKENKRRYKKQTVKVSLPSSSLSIEISSV